MLGNVIKHVLVLHPHLSSRKGTLIQLRKLSNSLITFQNTSKAFKTLGHVSCFYFYFLPTTLIVQAASVSALGDVIVPTSFSLIYHTSEIRCHLILQSRFDIFCHDGKRKFSQIFPYVTSCLHGPIIMNKMNSVAIRTRPCVLV